MKTKPLTFLLALTFLFLFSGSSIVFADDLQMVRMLTQQDYKTAYKLILPLAEQGDGVAQSNLGLMYSKGQGVPQDYKEAVKWYRLSAEQEFVSAQFNLGLMYAKGQEILQDNTLAHMWWSICGGKLHEGCVKNRYIVERKITYKQWEKSLKMALYWKPTKK
jgi:uncharacterized protein